MAGSNDSYSALLLKRLYEVRCVALPSVPQPTPPQISAQLLAQRRDRNETVRKVLLMENMKGTAARRALAEEAQKVLMSDPHDAWATFVAHNVHHALFGVWSDKLAAFFEITDTHILKDHTLKDKCAALVVFLAPDAYTGGQKRASPDTPLLENSANKKPRTDEEALKPSTPLPFDISLSPDPFALLSPFPFSPNSMNNSRSNPMDSQNAAVTTPGSDQSECQFLSNMVEGASTWFGNLGAQLELRSCGLETYRYRSQHLNPCHKSIAQDLSAKLSCLNESLSKISEVSLITSRWKATVILKENLVQAGLSPPTISIDVLLHHYLEIPLRNTGQKPFYTERLKHVFPYWDEEDYSHCLLEDLKTATVAVQSLCLPDTVVRLRFHEELNPKPVFIAALMEDGHILFCYSTRVDADM